jgi:general secretion pathway protein L
MANTIFSLDIHGDLVVGVMVNCLAKAHIVTGCAFAEVGSRSLESAVAEVVEQVGYKEGRCHVTFGADYFFFRNLQFPFTDKNKIGKIIPGELAENSPLEAEKMVCDFLLANNKGRGTSVIAAMTERSFVAEKLEVLKKLGVDPEILGISGTCEAICLGENPGTAESYIFLDIGLHKAVLILVIERTIALVRPLAFDAGLQAGFQINVGGQGVSPLRPENLASVYASFARSVRQTLLVARIGLKSQDLPLYLAGPVGAFPGFAEALRGEIGLEVFTSSLSSSPLLKIEEGLAPPCPAGLLDRAIAAALCAGKSERIFNFRKNEFRKKGSAKEYRRYARIASLPLLVLTLFGLAFCWQNYAALKNQQIALEKEIRTVFSETLPDVTRIVNPVQQLQVRINEARQTYMTARPESAGLGMLALLAEISGRIPPSLQVRIVKLVADQNDVRLKGTTENFNVVDSVRKELEKSPIFTKIEISSANLSTKDGAVDFELKLDLRR